MSSHIFYHWSPTGRRNQIEKRGLTPGVWSRDRLWRPPYVCLAANPKLAWGLSGGMKSNRLARELGVGSFSWDLWEVDVREQSGFEELYFDSGEVKEIRVYERIYKRNVWYVGSREL